MMDFWYYILSHTSEIANQTLEHLQLTVISMLIASLLGISIGILISRFTRLSVPVLGFVGVIQTIPSLALLGFLLPVFGIGKVPAIIALFLYGLLPIVRNTYVGIIEVNSAVREAARGMGMTSFQQLRYVELPLAFPVIMAGIKTSTVINVGVATLCAFIGAGGLGEFIFRGISLNNPQMILAGAIPASLLALLMDFFLGLFRKHYRNKWLIISTLPFILLLIYASFKDAIESRNDYKMIAGFNSEFIERADGFAGLDSLYDLPLNIKEMEIGLMYKSLYEGKVDVIDGFSTDGRIKAYDLKLLKDDKKYFPPYQAAPIIHQQTLNDHPSLLPIFQRFESLISDEKMAELNYQIDHEKRELEEVAYEFLTEHQVPARKKAGAHNAAEIIIGSKAFTENFLLAYMFAQAIEGGSHLTTRLQLGFGGTKLVFDALRTREIDLYPEYTGTGLLVILNTKDHVLHNMDTEDQVYSYVKKAFLEKHNIRWLPPLGFNNTFALMMRRKEADSLGISSISDLSHYLNN